MGGGGGAASLCKVYKGLKSGMAFEGTTGAYERIYRYNSKPGRKKEEYANSK